MVKKTVNFDVPDVYHLYFADELGTPGSVLTFFEYPGAPLGEAGAGMIHTIAWRVDSEDALGFWEMRLKSAGLQVERGPELLTFRDPEGLRLELRISAAPRMRAIAPDVPDEFALNGFAGVRAFLSTPEPRGSLLGEVLGFEEREREFSLEGDGGRAVLAFDRSPGPGVQAAGSVHHIAWACADDDHEAWRLRLSASGADVTPIIDRTYFRSIYFREPNGILFEIATRGPGFTVDESAADLGNALQLPSQYESMRSTVESQLTPIRNPRMR